MIWLELHIFYLNNLDFLLKRGIEPFIDKYQSILDSWFFIRYMENGQHIRLRLKINEKLAPIIKAEAKEYFNLFFSKNQLSNEPLLEANHIVFYNYKPEVERYGGQFGINISERFFQYSSELVLSLIDEDSNYENKLLLTTVSNFNLALVFFEDKNKLNTFFEEIANDWLQFNIKHLNLSAKEIKTKLKKIQAEATQTLHPLLKSYTHNHYNEIDDEFSVWRMNNQLIKDQLEKAQLTKPIPTILKSYIHMNNNRFGISNFDESLVSYLLTKNDLRITKKGQSK